MTDKAAIAAQLVDVRNVGQHKAIKLTVHVPAEQAGLVMAAFGWPTMADPVPVALARLDLSRTGVSSPAEGDAPVPAPLTAKATSSASASRRGEPSNRLAQRAGILCNDPMFHKYLAHRNGLPCIGELNNDRELAADWLRKYCRVQSRADIKLGTESETRLNLVESAFVAWRDVPEYADG